MFFKRKAILMIHGFVGGSYDFNNFHNELQLYRKFDVFTYTLPAHDKMIVSDVKYKEWLDESTKQIEYLINNGYNEIYDVLKFSDDAAAIYIHCDWTAAGNIIRNNFTWSKT